MVIDFISVALIILSLIKGLRKGLVVAVFSLLAFVIGLAAALKLSAVVAEYLGASTSISQKWLPMLAFLIIFFLVALLVRLGARGVESVMRMTMLGWLNKLGGIVFYLLLYFLVYSIILFYATKLHIIKSETIQTSTTYPIIYPMAPIVMDAIGQVVPFFKNMFSDLEGFFDNLSRRSH
jgi:membrane protein required for colicin V production